MAVLPCSRCDSVFTGGDYKVSVQQVEQYAHTASDEYGYVQHVWMCLRSEGGVLYTTQIGQFLHTADEVVLP